MQTRKALAAAVAVALVAALAVAILSRPVPPIDPEAGPEDAPLFETERSSTSTYGAAGAPPGVGGAVAGSDTLDGSRVAPGGGYAAWWDWFLYGGSPERHPKRTRAITWGKRLA